MDCPFIDIHTHTVSPEPDVFSIVSLSAGDDVPSEGFFSSAVHPWDFRKEKFPFERAIQQVEQNALRPNILAIGETGLDSLHSDTLPLQKDSLIRHIRLAEKVCKPVILHAVHSANDILEQYISMRPSQPWILHGFNGNGQEISQLVNHGLYLSVGAAVLKDESRIARSIATLPLDHLFLETDTSDISIKEIYLCIAERLGISLSDLHKHLCENFHHCFSLNLLNS